MDLKTQPGCTTSHRIWGDIISISRGYTVAKLIHRTALLISQTKTKTSGNLKMCNISVLILIVPIRLSWSCFGRVLVTFCRIYRMSIKSLYNNMQWAVSEWLLLNCWLERDGLLWLVVGSPHVRALLHYVAKKYLSHVSRFSHCSWTHLMHSC